MLTALKNIREHYIEWSIALLLFMAYFYPSKIGLAILVTALAIGFGYDKKQLRFTLNPLSVLFFCLYIAYLGGVLFTQNEEQAMKYLEYKLAFLLFPVLFSFSKKNGFRIEVIYIFMIIFSLISFIKNSIPAFECFAHYGSFPYCFLKGHLSPDIHPTYLSFLLCITILGLYSLWKKKYIHGFLFAGIFVVLSLYTILLMSLSGVIFYLFLVTFYVCFWLYRRLSLLWFSLLGVSLIGLAFVFFLKTPFLKDDVRSASAHLQKYLENPDAFVRNAPSEPGGTETRLIMWTVAWQEIAKHPFGVGTGNVDIYLGRNLVEKGKAEFAKQQYNPHNQFLQTTLEIGVFGLAILLLIVFYAIRIAIRNRHWLLLLLVLNMFFNCLFESMLQSQIGVVFYPLFMLLFIVEIKSNPLNSREP